jgi:hypothetical protein
MNKKIAVLVFGEYRYLDVAVKSWESMVNYKCDFYFSTWDTTQIKGNYEKLYDVDRTPVTNDMITNYIPNATIQILNQLELEFTHNHLKQIYHWKNLINMSSNKNYDILIVIRTDIFFNKSLFNFNDIIKRMSNNILYGKTFIPSSYVKEFENNLFDDCFFMGYYDIIKKFIDTIDIFNKNAKNTHAYLRDLCQSIQIGVSSITNSTGCDNNLYAIVRPTIKNIHSQYHNFDNIKISEQYFGISNKNYSPIILNDKIDSLITNNEVVVKEVIEKNSWLKKHM